MRQYSAFHPACQAVLALFLALGAVGYQPITPPPAHRFNPHIECVITHGTPTRPPSRVCHWVRS